MSYYVYIATNYTNSVLYTGITNNPDRRMFEHANKSTQGFTSRYNINKLIFAEEFPTAYEAISAEKKIKGWTRAKKISLIKKSNPKFEDLLKIDPSLRSG
jgi:putative endonuclease